MNMQDIESLASYAASLSDAPQAIDAEYLASAIRESCSLAILGLQRSHLANELETVSADLQKTSQELSELTAQFASLSADHTVMQIERDALKGAFVALSKRLRGKIELLYAGQILQAKLTALESCVSDPASFLVLHAEVSAEFASRFAPANVLVDHGRTQAHVVPVPHLFIIGG
jgi:hypothetical protein